MNPPRKFTPFALLNTIQFVAAINENLYKLLAAYFLISVLGEEKTNSIMSNIGALFILPFLLFSSLGGILADKWPKNRIVIGTRFLELVTLCIAFFFFAMNWTYGAYIILFFMASFSAIFGPTKYSLIPELIEPHRLLYGNSVIAAFTYLGIIIGTGLPSLVIWFTRAHYTAALGVSAALALFGFIISFFLPTTPVENKEKPFKLFFYSELWESLRDMSGVPSLLGAVFSYSYLLFLGSYLQLNIIPYTEKILNLSDIDGGYFFLITALGLGIGAYLTNAISRGNIRLSLVPISGLGISVIMGLMYFFYTPWWLIVVWMLLLGFLGGVFVVPPQAFILAESPEQDRGRNFATANFLSFSFALLAAFALYVLNTLLELSPATSFLVIAVLNALIMLFLIIDMHWLRRGANPTVE